MTKLEGIERKYSEFKDHITELKILKEEKETSLKECSLTCKAIESSKEDLVNARELLEECNILSRDFIKEEVEELVTQGLCEIFEDPYIEFNINFVEKRNQTEALFYLTTKKDDQLIKGDIISTYGGGIVDVISISLRIIIMQLLRLEGPLILDEPGKNISSQYIGNFGKFLIDVSKAFDRQIIMVTHNRVLADCANNIIKVEQKNGISFTSTS